MLSMLCSRMVSTWRVTCLYGLDMKTGCVSHICCGSRVGLAVMTSERVFTNLMRGRTIHLGAFAVKPLQIVTSENYLKASQNSLVIRVSKTRAIAFATMADDVGLRDVHNFVYAYLSGMSHPDLRLNHIFDMSESVVARIPKRDAEEEFRLSLWFSWFTSRILVLASREFAIDHEPFVAENLLPLLSDSEVNLETCVFVRECRNA